MFFFFWGLLKAAFSSYFLVFVPETKQIVDWIQWMHPLRSGSRDSLERMFIMRGEKRKRRMSPSFGQIEMCHIGISLVIHIVLPCIYISQAALLRPAGGWAPVPAAFPTVARGEGKPAGPERQRAGWRGSQGGSAGKNSLGERQESDHQRVRRRREGGLTEGFATYHLI